MAFEKCRFVFAEMFHFSQRKTLAPEAEIRAIAFHRYKRWLFAQLLGQSPLPFLGHPIAEVHDSRFGSSFVPGRQWVIVIHVPILADGHMN
jgi:hypothetical protein